VGSAPHGEQTARILARLEPILQQERPDRVLIIGDTNSTLAGALAASKLWLPLGHIEAGLRSFNRRMPEEINRICADHLSDRLYYATDAARRNLETEGLIARGRALGDVSFDAVRLCSGLVPGEELERARGKAPAKGYVLVTLHRAETTDDPELLRRIWRRLQELPAPTVFPIHPRTRAAASALGLGSAGSLRLMDPVGYPAMLALLRDAALLVTDSGGLQKEAYFVGTPCLTMRRETEWVETVRAGWNRLYDVGGCPPIDLAAEAGRRGPPIEEYGRGDAAERIVADLEEMGLTLPARRDDQIPG